MFTKLPYVPCSSQLYHPLHSVVDLSSPPTLLSLSLQFTIPSLSLVVLPLAIARLTTRNHLRPFLGRVQAQGGPDLFTPNPSLLHHLPQQNGASHGLVNTTQSSASTSGGGSAGRAGYQGGSAGSGGGYTVRLLCHMEQSL